MPSVARNLDERFEEQPPLTVVDGGEDVVLSLEDLNGAVRTTVQEVFGTPEEPKVDPELLRQQVLANGLEGVPETLHDKPVRVSLRYERGKFLSDPKTVELPMTYEELFQALMTHAEDGARNASSFNALDAESTVDGNAEGKPSRQQWLESKGDTAFNVTSSQYFGRGEEVTKFNAVDYGSGTAI